jgi:Tol biopolymer transport system component
MRLVLEIPETLAFARTSAEGQSIYTTPVLGGEEKRIITNAKPRFAWTSDSREILFANLDYLWKVSVRGGEPERLQYSQDGFQPSIRGNRLVYVKGYSNFNIWKRELKSLISAGPPNKLISSTRLENGPQFSFDGSKIAFQSTRSGAYEVWVCRTTAVGQCS